MAGHDRKKQVRSANVGRRLLVGMGASAGVFLAAAAMATGATVTAAPAKADFEDLLDPIIQPILTSLTDSIGAFDPAAAVDLTSWTDSFLASLNSIDLALPSAAEPAAAVAAASDAASSSYTIPLTVLGDPATEPAVNASIDGGSSVPLLVDTGSSGLVIPYQDLDPANSFSALLDLFKLGFPASFGVSGYSGGVEYIYATYNDLPVDYLNDSGGTVLSTSGPVDVELFSWPTSFASGAPLDFQQFLSDNSVDGILGVGAVTGGPTTSPFDSFGNVTVDISNPGAGTGDLIVGGDPVTGTSLSGAPIITDYISIDGGALHAVSNDVDSGGVTGTIPSSLLTSSEYNSTTDLVNPGTTIAVYADKAGTEELYHYTVTAANAPIVVSGNIMDSGVEPFLLGPISMEYSPTGTGTTIFGS
jgi:hypothetical protein